ncbi:cytochrome c oxidase subunit 7C, mitochondrial-like [Bombyx mandarina]|uniref:Cytochrome c oxidase subunit 7C, mitochondrial-like n=1 Tax=Bombyx mandarina TaxID=7092 RepID=A0A6J2KQ92_BOMMA|nr:cytochrome c oxidase subunit 7C, mitochondrial-like [Bombyx mandarina]
MSRLRALFANAFRGRSYVGKAQESLRLQNRHHHDEGPPQPFDNLPFKFTNRYVATLVFSIFFGTGFWAPFIILWYSMAKKSL